MVLLRPQMGENIGAAARAMRNFGLRRLRLVAPGRLAEPAAVAMASLPDEAKLHATTAEDVADRGMVFATTARAG